MNPQQTEDQQWELRQENARLRDQLASLSSTHAKECKRLNRELVSRNEALQKISEILIPPASNRRFMQIAGPARQCLNITKRFRTPATDAGI